MPAATHEPGGLADALDQLRSALGESLQLDVIGLVPRFLSPEHKLSRAAATVVVRGIGNDSATQVADALLRLQAAGGHELTSGPDATTWAALGLPPQASFVVTVPLQLSLPSVEVPLVQHPLDAHLFDRHNPDAPASRP